MFVTPLCRSLIRFALGCCCLIASANSTALAIEYPTRTKGSTKVRIYEQRLMPETNGGAKGGPGHVIAKYSDLIQKAIAYKQQHPSETVEIRFATYKLSKFVYIGFNPSASSTYLGVSNTDFAGANSEKLMWSLRKAAQAGVKVKVIFQLPGESSVPLSELTDYFDNETSANFEYKVCNWATGNMHNKFLLVSRTRTASGGEYHSIVYNTSANVDEWKEWGPKSSKNWQQTGVLLYQNSGVYNAFKTYFDDALWPHVEDLSSDGFRATMDSLHHTGSGINYAEDADGISAYFYPVDPADFWDTTLNPVAGLFDRINNDGAVTEPFVKMDMYEVLFHNASYIQFGERYMDDLVAMANVHNIDLSDTSVANARLVVNTDDDDGNDYAPIASNRLSLGQPTHCKNYMFSFKVNGTVNYYSLGGATNGVHNSFARSANSIIMIREVGTANREVYQDFYDIFQYIFHY